MNREKVKEMYHKYISGDRINCGFRYSFHPDFDRVENIDSYGIIIATDKYDGYYRAIDDYPCAGLRAIYATLYEQSSGAPLFSVLHTEGVYADEGDSLLDLEVSDDGATCYVDTIYGTPVSDCHAVVNFPYNIALQIMRELMEVIIAK